MESESILSELLDLADRLGIEVRQVDLAGNGGGLCNLKGKRVLFIDSNALVAEQVATAAVSLADLEEIQDCYLVPKVREVLDFYSEQE